MKNKTHERRKRNGLCVACGDRASVETKTKCVECAAKHVKSSKRLRECRFDQGLCRCGAPITNPGVKVCEPCRKLFNQRQKVSGPKSARKAKIEAFAAYGGSICKCCGITDLTVLTFDHVNGGGCKHKKELGSLGAKLYAHVRAAGFPAGYQVLCYNCNISKHRNKGRCSVHGTCLVSGAA